MKPACPLAAWTLLGCFLGACGSKLAAQPASDLDAAAMHDEVAMVHDAGAAPDHAAGAGGSGGRAGGPSTGGSEGSRDAENPEDVTIEASAEDAEIAPEEGGVGGCTPLPDGSGFLTFQTSGGVDLDVHLGNRDSCNGYWKPGGGVGITYFVPIPPSDASSNNTAILNVDVAGVQEGETANGQPASLSLVGSGHIWTSPDRCVVNITTNARVGAGTMSKVGGTVKCRGLVPEVFAHGDLSIEKFDFMIGVTAGN